MSGAQLHSSAEEVWKDIPGFADYQASNQGRIRSRKAGVLRVLSPGTNRGGYRHVELWMGGRALSRRVHTLVAAAFIGASCGRDTNHKNGVKADNRVENLEYNTRRENTLHAYRIGLRVPANRKITDGQAREVMALKGSMTQQAIADRFGVARTLISRIHAGILRRNAFGNDSARREAAA